MNLVEFIKSATSYQAEYPNLPMDRVTQRKTLLEILDKFCSQSSKSKTTEIEEEKELKEQNDLVKDEPEPVYLSDTIVYSNSIYQDAKSCGMVFKYLGKLSSYTLGHILGYLDYKTVMATVRYLSKSFIVYTQELLHYVPDLNQHAYLFADLWKVYTGEVKMPPLCHAYYKNCKKLEIIFIASTPGIKQRNWSKYETMFFYDLFHVRELFPNLTYLSIHPTHPHL